MNEEIIEEYMPHELRVVEEEIQLNERFDKLCGFMLSDAYNLLPDIEQDRLRRQHSAMQEYSIVLRERIEAFD